MSTISTLRPTSPAAPSAPARSRGLKAAVWIALLLITLPYVLLAVIGVGDLLPR